MPSFGPNGSVSSSGAAGAGFGGRVRFRADLHVHSRYSGRGHLDLPGARADLPHPEATYHAAKSRGMDLVTLTDLDTIDGCLAFMEDHPEATDFMISEEVTANEPRSGRVVHVLLFDITEALHREAQRLKADVRDLARYVRHEGILASLGPFLDNPKTGAWPEADLREVLELFDRFEIRNGACGRAYNDLMARLALETAVGRSVGVTAGSNAHALARIGTTATASGASTRTEYLEDLRHHRTWTIGENGGLRASSADLLEVLHPTLAAAPLGGHCLRRARVNWRIRRLRRRLDRMDVLRFKEKTRSYEPAAQAAGSVPTESN
jgi:predicted metal-dependent phosphoesterase TrpH